MKHDENNGKKHQVDDWLILIIGVPQVLKWLWLG
jgi:hypothetical protein